MERRKFIKSVVAISAVATSMAIPSSLMAKESKKKIEKFPQSKGLNSISYAQAVKEIIGNQELKESDKVKLRVPVIAENGAVVPVKVAVKSPMTEKDYVQSIHILNTKNSNSRCTDIRLTTKNAEAKFASRVKLSESQNIVAIVGLSDGTFIKATKSVKVTIGGCG